MPDDAPVWWDLHEYARQVREGIFRDDTFLSVHFGADIGDDFDDPAVWKKANPALGTFRSLADMRERLGFVPDYLIGNHGLEGVPGERRLHAALVRICRGWKDWLAPRLNDIDPAIWLEDKQYSLSLHFLNARDHAQSMVDLSALFAQLQPAPRVIPGKCIFSQNGNLSGLMQTPS